jgi:tetratricopeptide (TPR) repeat protein
VRTPVKPAIALLVALAIVIGCTEGRLSAALPWRYPAVNELVVTENYMRDVGCLLLGSHRLAGDIAYIDFLQYYGTGDLEAEAGPEAREHADESAKNHPRLLELGTRIVRLDPFFNGAILEVAGSLAFNQHRIDEALTLLKEAIERDPSFFRYHLYVSAILFKQNGNDNGLITLLKEAIRYPDCPPLFELILGNLLKKVGRTLEAAQVFLHTSQTAAKESERHDAWERLQRLVAEHPELVSQLQQAR